MIDGDVFPHNSCQVKRQTNSFQSTKFSCGDYRPDLGKFILLPIYQRPDCELTLNFDTVGGSLRPDNWCRDPPINTEEEEE